MKKILTILLLIFPISSNSQWIFQDSKTTKDLWSVDFLNIYTGIVVGDSGTVLKTTNGGVDWLKIQTPVLENFHSCMLLNSNTGFVLADRKLLRTTNSGLNWDIVMNKSGDSLLRTISFFKNSNTGYVLGPCLAFKTTDAGANWISVYTCPNMPYGEGKVNFYCSDRSKDTLIVAGGSIGQSHFSPASVFAHLTPSGISILGPYGADSWIGWITFAGNSGIGYAFQRGYHLRTEYFGYGWSPYRKFPMFGIPSFVDDSFGFFLASDKVFYYSTNSGDSWIYYDSLRCLSVICNFYLTDFQLLNRNVLTAIGNNGIIIRNNDLFAEIKSFESDVSGYFSIEQNYPNPFNPTTKIRFSIPKTSHSVGEGQMVKLVVYDILGREIATLVNETLTPGTYEVEWDGSNYASGVYYYQIKSADFTETRKLILVK